MSTRVSNESDLEARHGEGGVEKYFDYSQRAQWLRAIVLGGIEGLVSSVLLVIGVGMFIKEIKGLIITGLVGLAAGALNMAIAEFVSVYTQVDVIRSQNERDQRKKIVGQVPSPTQLALVASLAYVVGGLVPLTILVVRDQKLRLSIVAVMASFSMLLLGNIAASLGKAPVIRSCIRVLIGGWIEIAVMLGKREILEFYGL